MARPSLDSTTQLHALDGECATVKHERASWLRNVQRDRGASVEAFGGGVDTKIEFVRHRHNAARESAVIPRSRRRMGGFIGGGRIARLPATAARR